MLGIFGIELPHTHGAASLLAGEVLGPDHVQENLYFADVDGIAGNDGSYLRFGAGERTIHIAQGLGAFEMDRQGNIKPDDPRRALARYILRRTNEPTTPILPHVNFRESLARSAALLSLRASSEVRRNLPLA